MLDDFMSRAVAFLDRDLKDDLEWLALAQHHGMATRLLDWSANAMAALWFAVEQPARKSDGGGREDAVFWTLTRDDADNIKEVERKNPFGARRTCAFRPRHINRRIAAQSGWFTLHASIGSGRGSPMSPLEQQAEYAGRLKKRRIAGDAFPTIRRQLHVAGIHSASLYADLVGLCKHVDWQQRCLDDEDDR